MTKIDETHIVTVIEKLAILVLGKELAELAQSRLGRIEEWIDTVHMKPGEEILTEGLNDLEKAFMPYAFIREGVRPDEAQPLVKDIGNVVQFSDAMVNLFWALLKNRVLPDEPASIGIREGGKIVRNPG